MESPSLRSPDRVPAYILAGGKSMRFGSDKARVIVGGEPLIIKVARMLDSVASQVTVVADRAGKYQDLGLLTIGDLQAGLGPLGGLQAALAHHGGQGFLLCTSCDRIGIRPEWLHALLAASCKGKKAVAFRGDLWHPLPALYPASLSSLVDQAISAGRLTLWNLLERADAVSLPVPRGWENTRDINHPQTLLNSG